VLSAGIEPASQVPQTCILSIELREHGRISFQRGGGEIRTHGPITQTPVFKTGAIDHSATPPRYNQISLVLLHYTTIFLHFFEWYTSPNAF
jgi:hypothetical protein